MVRALVVFHGHGDGWLSRLLKPGFRHVFAAINDGAHWVLVDGKAGVPEVRVLAASDYDLETFYRAEGFTVVPTRQRAIAPHGPVAIANCVGMVKALLCIRAPLAFTPWALYRHLTRRKSMFRLPGGSLFGSPSPPPPAVAKPTPRLDDEEVQKKRDEDRRDQKRRRGLAGTIMTGGLGDTTQVNVSRKLLGG